MDAEPVDVAARLAATAVAACLLAPQPPDATQLPLQEYVLPSCVLVESGPRQGKTHLLAAIRTALRAAIPHAIVVAVASIAAASAPASDDSTNGGRARWLPCPLHATWVSRASKVLQTNASIARAHVMVADCRAGGSAQQRPCLITCDGVDLLDDYEEGPALERGEGTEPLFGPQQALAALLTVWQCPACRSERDEGDSDAGTPLAAGAGAGGRDGGTAPSGDGQGCPGSLCIIAAASSLEQVNRRHFVLPAHATAVTAAYAPDQGPEWARQLCAGVLGAGAVSGAAGPVAGVAPQRALADAGLVHAFTAAGEPARLRLRAAAARLLREGDLMVLEAALAPPTPCAIVDVVLRVQPPPELRPGPLQLPSGVLWQALEALAARPGPAAGCDCAAGAGAGGASDVAGVSSEGVPAAARPAPPQVPPPAPGAPSPWFSADRITDASLDGLMAALCRPAAPSPVTDSEAGAAAAAATVPDSRAPSKPEAPAWVRPWAPEWAPPQATPSYGRQSAGAPPPAAVGSATPAASALSPSGSSAGGPGSGSGGGTKAKRWDELRGFQGLRGELLRAVVLPVLAWHHASRQALPPHAAARLRPLASDVPGVDGALIARMAAAMPRMRVRPPAGLLLHGPPGCGKSTLAAAVARGAQMRLLVVDAALMLSKYVGDSEASIRALFRAARAASPCCLVIENVHVIGGVRAGGHGGEGEAAGEGEGEGEAEVEGEGEGEASEGEASEGDAASGGEGSADEVEGSDQEEEVEGVGADPRKAATRAPAHAVAAAGDDVASLSVSVAGLHLSDARVHPTEIQPVPAAGIPVAPRRAAARSARARAIAAARLIAQAAPRSRKGRRQPNAGAAPSCVEPAAAAAGAGASSAAAYAPAPTGARRGASDGARGSASIHDRMLATVLTELDGVGVRRTEKAGAAAGAAAAAGGAGSPAAAAGDGLMDTESPLVLVIGITEVRAAIDPALLRPGRLDRHVHVGYPSAEDRRELLRHALRPRSAAALDSAGGSTDELSAELQRLVAASAGFSTAEVLQLASRPPGV
jgi:SpoVK/Ycf46/Vps4 family AAA+-type ATPase